MRKIKILALHNGSGVAYHRVLKPMRGLTMLYPNDYEVHYIHVKNKDISSLPDVNYTFDVIYFNTILGIDDDSPLLPYLEHMLSKGAKIVLDIDDYFEFGRSVLVKKDVGYKHASLVPEAIRASDYVTTTTETYQKKLLELNKNVEVFPNFADEFDPQYKSEKTLSRKIRIGVTGSAMHKYDVQILKGVPYMLKKDGYLSRIQFVLCGYADNFVYHGYEKILTDEYRTLTRTYRHRLEDKSVIDINNEYGSYRRIGWRNIDTYMSIYNELDVLLAPLEDTKFNSAKSQIKYIEAGYMDTVFVGSDVPSYNNYVSNGVNGFLCKNKIDFSNTIKLIVDKWDDTNGLKGIREAAKLDIQKRFTLTEVTKKRNDFFKKIVL